ncbi:MAG: signal peptidase I [Fimbriimonadales bacterium]|nr:signal peptidase I [Fimbriimonadales bacterium]
MAKMKVSHDRVVVTNSNTRRGSPLKPYARNLFLFVGLSVFLFLVFFFFNFQQVEVTGSSMEPTFHDGQRVLVGKALWLVGPIQRGDVVVIRGDQQGEYWIKRVVWLEGDVVDVTKQPYNWDFMRGPYQVPKGHIYVLGDNLADSEDSRTWGAIPLSRVFGKVMAGG